MTELMTNVLAGLLVVLGCIGVAISITVKLLVVQCLQRQQAAAKEWNG